MLSATPQQQSVYRRENGVWLIELKLRELRQLFHLLDPAPFREKDLDPGAEQYIVEAFREIGHDKPARLVIHLPAAECESEEARSLPEAVGNYFNYRARQERIELRSLLKRGVVSLTIGLAFLFACLWLRRSLSGLAGDSLFAEGLLIIGWVALWRPIEIFLYDWWPIYRRERRLAAIAKLPIEIRG